MFNEVNLLSQIRSKGYKHFIHTERNKSLQILKNITNENPEIASMANKSENPEEDSLLLSKLFFQETFNSKRAL